MSEVRFDVEPGDELTFLPDGTILGPLRLTYETTPDGAMFVHVRQQVAVPVVPHKGTEKP